MTATRYTAANLIADALAVLLVWVPYLMVVGLCRAARWVVTTGIPHGAYYLVVAVVVAFLALYLAVRFVLTHGPDTVTALADGTRHLAAAAWSRVNPPARFVLGGTAAALVLFAALFTMLSAM